MPVTPQIKHSSIASVLEMMERGPALLLTACLRRALFICFIANPRFVGNPEGKSLGDYCTCLADKLLIDYLMTPPTEMRTPFAVRPGKFTPAIVRAFRKTGL